MNLYSHVFVATSTRESHADGQIVPELEIGGGGGGVNRYFGSRELRHYDLVEMISVVLCLITQV